MAHISIPNVFEGKDLADSTKVNENFEAITDGLSDGLSDISARNIEIDTLNFLADTKVDSNSLTLGGLWSITDAECRTKIRRLGFTTITNLVVISSGVITPNKTCVNVGSEGGVSSADDLDTITAGALTTGTIMILYTTQASGIVTVKNNTGNIQCGSDRAISKTGHQTMTLIYDGSDWLMLTYAG